MDVFLILTLGAFSGAITAQFVSWFGLVWCAPVLATVSAIVLQKQGFSWLSGIAMIVACLSLNQFGYLLGAYFKTKLTIHHAREARTTFPKSTNGTTTAHVK